MTIQIRMDQGLNDETGDQTQRARRGGGTRRGIEWAMKWTLYSFLEALDKRKIFYRLGRVREDTVMVEVTVPGERWEVEFFGDGEVEIEVYRSEGKILDESAITDMLQRNAEQ